MPQQRFDPYPTSWWRPDRILVLLVTGAVGVALAVRAGVRAEPAATTTPVHLAAEPAQPPPPGVHSAALPTATAPVPPAQQRGGRPFRHAPHDALACTRCHSTDAAHGRVTIAAPRDCMACHHAPEQRAGCAACHDPASIRDITWPVAQAFRIADRPAQTRQIPFVHDNHAAITCAECHAAPLTLSARSTECGACHRQHHDATLECTRCHLPPPERTHTRTAHVSCTGAGCHTARPFTEQARTRTLCLACHTELADHKPGGNCVECHVLPPWHTAVPSRSGGS